jgi:DmsE family decaheme c-type cytochrome
MRNAKNIAAALIVCATVGSWFFAPATEAQEVVCAKCHDSAVAGLKAGKHSAHKDPTGSTCQSCHGDASPHLQDPAKNAMKKVFAKTAPASDKEKVCLTCHGGNRQLTFWDAGKHKKNDVACNDCHNIHSKPGNPSISPFVTTLRTLQHETCSSCHKQIRAQINKTSHHPIVEGKVACSDCHNPHGAMSQAMVKEESVNKLCVNCHGDKRGPFVWEHAPVEENCLTCHNSHGSNHAKLLNEKVPNLCQDCHDWSRHPGTYYGGNQSFAPGAQNTRFLARSCINCHQTIHGSNAPGNRGKFFTR